MFERSLEIEPSHTGYSNLATLYFYQGQYVEAARMYEKALEFNDHDYVVWGIMASAYYWTPDERYRAEDAYRRAIAIAEDHRKVNPHDAGLLSQLAGYYLMAGEDSQAHALLKKVIAIKPEDLHVLFRIGSTYEILGEREAAQEWIGKAMQEGYSLAEIESAPSLRELRSVPRFQELQRLTESQR